VVKIVGSLSVQEAVDGTIVAPPDKFKKIQGAQAVLDIDRHFLPTVKELDRVASQSVQVGDARCLQIGLVHAVEAVCRHCKLDIALGGLDPFVEVGHLPDRQTAPNCYPKQKSRKSFDCRASFDFHLLLQRG
jgi:hypothetical protein